MKYLALLIAIIATSISAYSGPKPAHYNNWIFGKNAGITFSTTDGNPETLDFLDDEYRFLEGTSSISDDNGNLLYYLSTTTKSEYATIQSIDDTIKNGSNIESGANPSNSGLFVQDFSNPNLYHLITVPDIPDTPVRDTNKGIFYNVIDITKNGGRGEVILKNKLLYPNTTEKLTAVVNEIDEICWVITHELNNNTFRVIKIDTDGLDENIMTQPIGLEHKSSIAAVGTGRMNISPNGTTLAVTIPFYDPNESGDFKGDVELFKFDPKTGELSNPCPLNLNENTYSTAFSPNGKVLYVKVTNKIYQYDLTICDIDEMIEKRYTIETKQSFYYERILRSSNGIVYCGREDNTYLDAILNPDIIGEGCNYTEDVIDIGGEFIWGLPTVINSYFTGEYDDYCFVHEEEEEERTYKVSAPTNACYGDEIIFQIESENGDEFEADMVRTPFIQNLVTEPVGPNASTNSVANIYC